MKILSLDGGGMLGVGQAYTLSRIQSTHRFDLVAGTSVGAVNALLYATGRASEAPKFFGPTAHEVFGSKMRRSFRLLGPRFRDEQLNRHLQNMFPFRFGDLEIPTIVTAADLNRRRLKVFSSIDADDAKWPAWEVVRCSIAAPTYIAPWKGFADGGVYANNPAMVAVAEASRAHSVLLRDMSLVSLGTGTYTQGSGISSTRWWSTPRWGAHLLRILLDGTASSMHEHFVETLRLKNYVRMQFIRYKDWHFTDPAVPAKVIDTYLGLFENNARTITTILNARI